MQITGITQQKRNAENVNVFLDNEFWISLSKNQMIYFNLYRGREITQDEKILMESASGENKLLEKIHRFLAVRLRSKAELLTYLTVRRSIDKEYARSLSSKLEEQGYIDDEKFAKWYIQNRTNYGIHGKNKIKAELIKKGVAREIIDELLKEEKENEESNETQKLKIQEYINKNIGKVKAENTFELRNKLIQKLMGRGFSYDEVKELVEEAIN